jgi:cysteine desulfurase/selenocysteine lyase
VQFEAVPDQFPVLSQNTDDSGRRFVYLDSAATSLMPLRVLEALDSYEKTSRSNIHRGIHRLAEKSTDAFELSREELAAVLGVDPESLILTHGTTESINIVAHGWKPLTETPQGGICVAEDNHHANIVPWQMAQRDKGVFLDFLPITPRGILDGLAWNNALKKHPVLIALTHISNVIGSVLPAKDLIAQAHAAGAAVLLDCAQSFGHEPLDLDDLDVDFAAGSIHKAYGPFGIGFLYCRPDRLQQLRPLMGGGGMIGRVTRDGFTLAEGVSSFEGGTPTVSAAMGMRESLSFMLDLGVKEISEHNSSLAHRAAAGLAQIDGVQVLGADDLTRNSLVSFVIDHVHAHDAAAAFDDFNIAVRAGHHCAMPLHQALGAPASVRASFAAYSTMADVEALLEAGKCISDGRKHGRLYRNRG